MALLPGDLLVATSADPLQPLSGGVFALCLPSPCWEPCAGQGPLHGRLASSWLSPPLPPATYPLAVLQGVGLILGITSLAEFLEKFGILLSDFPFKASSATGQERSAVTGHHGQVVVLSALWAEPGLVFQRGDSQAAALRSDECRVSLQHPGSSAVPPRRGAGARSRRQRQLQGHGPGVRQAQGRRGACAFPAFLLWAPFALGTSPRCLF